MSCYLTFYGVPVKPKNNDGEVVENESDIDKKPIAIVSFSRNDDVFRYFDENCSIHYTYNNVKYTDINDSDVDAVEKDINNDIRSSEKRLLEYEKYASSNSDYIQEIISIKEYLDDLYRALHYVEFIGKIVREAGYSYSGGFDKIVANMG